MIEYTVMLKRHAGSIEPDICICREYDRKTAINEMKKYYQKYGFSYRGFSIADIVIVEQEPIVGSPVINVTPYREIINA